MASAPIPPERSLQQRYDALEVANAVRSYRSALKKALKAGKVSVVPLLKDPPKEIETMQIIDLVSAVPRIGKVKVNRLLYSCRIPPFKTISGMSERQRNEIITRLTHR